MATPSVSDGASSPPAPSPRTLQLDSTSLLRTSADLASIWSNGSRGSLVDLMNDYAGPQLFVVDADSLLEYLLHHEERYAPSHAATGPHPIHIAYVLESFLAKLRCARAHFHLVWFEDRADLAVLAHQPSRSVGLTASTSDGVHIAARSFMRTMIKAHLDSRCSQTVTQHSFPSIESGEWSAYLHARSPLFVLLHDGFYLDNKCEGNNRPSAAGLVAAMGTLAVRLHIKGSDKQDRPPLSIALIRDGMFHDTKVRTFVIGTGIKIREECSEPAKGKLAAMLQKSLSRASELLTEPSNDVTALAEPFSQAAVSPHDEIVTRAYHAALKVGLGEAAGAGDSMHALLLYAAVGPLLDVHQRVAIVDVAGGHDQAGSQAGHGCLAQLYDAAKRLLEANESTVSQCTHSLLLVDPSLYLALARCFAKNTIPLSIHTPQVIQHYNELCESVGVEPRSLTATVAEDSTLPQLRASGHREQRHEVHDVVDFGSISFSDIAHYYTPTPLTGASSKARIDYGLIRSWPKDRQERYIARKEMQHHRKQQRLAAWLHLYAASLTGANGGVLEKQTISVNRSGGRALPAAIQQSGTTKAAERGAPKKPAKLSKKDAIIAANHAAKASKAAEHSMKKWVAFVEEKDIGVALKSVDSTIGEGEARKMLQQRKKLGDSLANRLVKAKRDAIDELCIRLLIVRMKLESWLIGCAIGEKDLELAVQLFMACQETVALLPSDAELAARDHVDIFVAAAFATTSALAVLGLESTLKQRFAALWDDLKAASTLGKREAAKVKAPLPFDFPFSKAGKRTALPPDLDAIRFQLLHCGDHMERQLDSAPDPRVTFVPDKWQREVLDKIDAGHSMLVVAPTSAGKTFSSFYAIEKVLREGDNGVVIFCLPTKALVNQVAAEIEARYAKSYAGVGTTLYSVAIRDYTVNNPFKAQVLITVPEMLESLLLTTHSAKALVPRVRYLMVDEVHTLGEMQRSLTYEQIIVMCPAPIIALSATIGNVATFGAWLANVSAAHGHAFSIIEHKTRYSDLVKHVYLPHDVEELQGFESAQRKREANKVERLKHFHPWCALAQGDAQLVDDLEMSPAEMAAAHEAMLEVSDSDKYPKPDVDIDSFFPTDRPIKRADTLAFQARLRQQLERWMAQPDARRCHNSPFMRLLTKLDGGICKAAVHFDATRPFNVDNQDFWDGAMLQLLVDMNDQGFLPGLFFNHNRLLVEKLAENVTAALVEAERAYKDTDKWKDEVRAYKQEKREHETQKQHFVRQLARAPEGSSAEKKAQEALDRFLSTNQVRADFDPDGVLPQYTFVGIRRSQALTEAESEEELAKVQEHVSPLLVEGLRRGVAAHHAGLPSLYRQIVERWTRLGRIRVCFCTGSLALGLNVPARSSVFVGDSHYLNALSFRQAAGRAGRRGLDLRGNVIFFGVPLERIQRLLTSKVPELQGSFPLSTTLTVRLHTLLSSPEASKTAKDMIDAMLRLSRLSSSGNEARVHHQLRASIEYVRRFGLLDHRGCPVDLAGLVSHLPHYEPGNLAFAALLREGFFFRLCHPRRHEKDKENAGRALVQVLCHIFNRQPKLPADSMRERVKVSPSIVFLDPLPDDAAEVLSRHSRCATEAYRDVVVALAQSEGSSLPPDGLLPLSGHLVEEHSADLGPTSSPPARARSLFWQLLGLGDTYKSVTEVSHSLRPGLTLTAAAIPAFDIYLSSEPLNAYLLDFYKHGNVSELVSANGLRPGDVWSKLEDFFGVLSSLRTSIEMLLRCMVAVRERAEGRDAAAADTVAGRDQSVCEDWMGSDADDDDDDDNLFHAAASSSTAPTSPLLDEGGEDTDDDEEAKEEASGHQPQPQHQDHHGGRRRRRTPVIPPLIVLDAKKRDPQLWQFYLVLVHVQREFGRKFFATFS